MSLFSEVGESLEKIRLNSGGSITCAGMEFFDVLEMLKQEFYEFEV